MNTINLPWAGTASFSPTAPSTELKSHGNLSYRASLKQGTLTEDSMMSIIVSGISGWKVLGSYSLPLVPTRRACLADGLMWACSRNPAVSPFRLGLHEMRINWSSN